MTIKNTADHVEELRPRVPALSAEELAERLDRGDEVVVLDIREVQERVDLGAVPGSHHVPRGMLEFWADPASKYHRAYFDEDTEYVVYCAGGNRSVLASVALMDMGYRKVSHLDQGFRGWAASGQQVEDVAATSKWVRRDHAEG